jgi:hypothetical protein
VFEELCSILDGGDPKKTELRKGKTNVVMFVGLQGECQWRSSAAGGARKCRWVQLGGGAAQGNDECGDVCALRAECCAWLWGLQDDQWEAAGGGAGAACMPASMGGGGGVRYELLNCHAGCGRPAADTRCCCCCPAAHPAGAGKTTTCTKYAHLFKKKGFKPAMVGGCVGGALAGPGWAWLGLAGPGWAWHGM